MSKLEKISNLEDADSDDDVFEFLSFVENVSILLEENSDNEAENLFYHKPQIHKSYVPSGSLKRKSFEQVSSQIQPNNKTTKIAKTNSTPNDFTEPAFHLKFRITKSTFFKLVRVLESRDQYIENRSHNPISLEIQVMIALRYYASGSYQNELCEYFSVHQTTIGRIVHRISSALEDILLDFIKMPVSDQETKEIQRNFYKVANFADVVGIVGAKHVPLNSPHGNDNILNYKNPSGNYSLILQIICDSNNRIMHIDASSPGSMANQQVFETCDIKDIFEKRSNSGVLLGDHTYESRPYILTPIANPITESEKKFNYYQQKTRLIVDNCFNMMQTRFPVLQNGLRVHISKSISIILALGVLHNFCVLNDDPLPPPE